MRLPFEQAHWFSKGAGNCNCPENKIRLTPYSHDVLDGRIRNCEVEHAKVIYKNELNLLPKAYRHKWAFAKVFNKLEEFHIAIAHYEVRNCGKTNCTRIAPRP